MAVLEYTVILTIVVLELLFAFGIGISCVILSLYILRKVSEETDAVTNPLISSVAMQPSYSALFLNDIGGDNTVEEGSPVPVLSERDLLSTSWLTRIFGWMTIVD
jgi:hypothetical protein